MPPRRLAVGLTPMETRREVVLHLADRAEALGYEAFFVAEGWGHGAGALLAEIAGDWRGLSGAFVPVDGPDSVRWPLVAVRQA